MDPVTLGLISMGVGGAIKLGGDLFDDTAGKQANIMRQQAQLKTSALEENMRRAEGAQTQVLSSTKARMAGTGFDSSSASFSGYLTGMSEQFAKQNKFTETQGQATIQTLYDAANDLEGAGALTKILKVAGDVAGTVGGMASLAKLGGADAVAPAASAALGADPYKKRTPLDISSAASLAPEAFMPSGFMLG